MPLHYSFATPRTPPSVVLGMRVVHDEVAQWIGGRQDLTIALEWCPAHLDIEVRITTPDHGRLVLMSAMYIHNNIHWPWKLLTDILEAIYELSEDPGP